MTKPMWCGKCGGEGVLKDPPAICPVCKGARQLNQAQPIHDPVHHPSHYTQGHIECIDAIESALGRDGFIAFLRGQVIKYQWRLGRKDAASQDNDKAIWYAKKLKEVLDEPL